MHIFRPGVLSSPPAPSSESGVSWVESWGPRFGVWDSRVKEPCDRSPKLRRTIYINKFSCRLLLGACVAAVAKSVLMKTRRNSRFKVRLVSLKVPSASGLLAALLVHGCCGRTARTWRVSTSKATLGILVSGLGSAHLRPRLIWGQRAS